MPWRGWSSRTGEFLQSYAGDFGDCEAVTTLGGELAERAPDILVNNAGTVARMPAAQYPLGWWDRVLEVNLTSHFVLTQLVARPMLERGSGKIAFTASLLSYQGGINVPGYTASKSAVAGLTKALANEWASHGVNVNAIAPGYIATDITQALQDDPERPRAILERIPAGRWGRATDLGGVVAFLASSASDYGDGNTIPVDGGWLGDETSDVVPAPDVTGQSRLPHELGSSASGPSAVARLRELRGTPLSRWGRPSTTSRASRRPTSPSTRP